jgi:hypothetical protein
MFTDPEKY